MAAVSARAPESRQIAVPSALRDVKQLIAQSTDGGMDTSAGLLFNESIWGRDRIITSLDLLPWQPELGRQTILTLAALQGTKRRRRSEEEPGRIHSEHRDLTRWCAPAYLKALFKLVISPMWGGDFSGYTSYSSSDATPLYIMLVAAYARHDASILAMTVRDKDGHVRTIREVVTRAVGWIESHITGDGLIEVPKRNPVSLQPVWKDGPTSNFNERGHMPNVIDPIAYLDVQVLCAEALSEAADLLREDRLRVLAQHLRDATIRYFWMADEQYFGVGLDRDNQDRWHLISAVQSNAGWMLATSFFDGMQAADREHYVSGIVRRLFAADMLTDAGVRGRSLADSNRSFRSYHENVWPVDTGMIARGLRRQGLPQLAEQIENRLVNVANILGGNYEFIVVDDAGRIVDPRREQRSADLPAGWSAALPVEMVPEQTLAWSVTAALRIKRERASRFARARDGGAAVGGAPELGASEPFAPQSGASEPFAPQPGAPEPWLTALTAEVLAGIRNVPIYRTRQELIDARAALSSAHLAHLSGLLRSAGTVAVQGFADVMPRAYGRRLRRRLGTITQPAGPRVAVVRRGRQTTLQR
jgi:glycogen debranching enzyme